MTTTPASHRPPKILRILSARWRLVMSALLGLGVILVLHAADLPTAMRFLIGWDVGIAVYLIVAYEAMSRADVTHIREQSKRQDEGSTAMLVLTVAAAMASLGAIVFELGVSNSGTRGTPQLVLATVTIVLSWGFIHTMFALHYAHEYYAEHRKEGAGGLIFPGGTKDAPDYWDFVYFAFVVGMTSQVSDVQITARPIRRTATAHGIVAFAFNAALLALTVNIAATALQAP